MTSALTPNLPPPGGWRVTTQQPATRVIPGSGQPVAGYSVGFITSDGTNGTVFIPLPQYTADNVKAAIASQVAAIDAVSNLTHDS